AAGGVRVSPGPELTKPSRVFLIVPLKRANTMKRINAIACSVSTAPRNQPDNVSCFEQDRVFGRTATCPAFRDSLPFDSANQSGVSPAADVAETAASTGEAPKGAQSGRVVHAVGIREFYALIRIVEIPTELEFHTLPQLPTLGEGSLRP